MKPGDIALWIDPHHPEKWKPRVLMVREPNTRTDYVYLRNRPHMVPVRLEKIAEEDQASMFKDNATEIDTWAPKESLTVIGHARR